MREFTIESLLIIAALLCTGIGSVCDVRTRRIPNWLTAGSILFALGLQSQRGWTELGLSLAAGLLAGGVVFLFFLAGGMGAGDVKLMTAVGCFTGLHALPAILLATAISGALFAIVLAWHHGRIRQMLRNTVELLEHHHAHGLEPHPELNMSQPALSSQPNPSVQPTLRIPYALPIFFGCAVAFTLHLEGALA